MTYLSGKGRNWIFLMSFNAHAITIITSLNTIMMFGLLQHVSKCILHLCLSWIFEVYLHVCSYLRVSARSNARLFCLVLLYVYDLLTVIHVQKYVCVYEYDVLQQCWIFCTSYTCTTYKSTSLLYSDELIVVLSSKRSIVHWSSYTTLMMCCVRPFGQKTILASYKSTSSI